MPGYLLDTNAISLLAPKRDTLEAVAFRTWVGQHSEALYLSAITVAELQAGVARLERKGASRKVDALARWLQVLIDFYGSRVLPLDTRSALEAGKLIDRAVGAGGEPGFEDAAIAAIAAVHDLTVVTANARHFKLFGIAFMAPPSA